MRDIDPAILSDIIVGAALREILTNVLIGSQTADALDGMASGVRERASAEYARRKASPPAPDASLGERFAAEIMDKMGAIYADAAQTRRGLDIQLQSAGLPKH